MQRITVELFNSVGPLKHIIQIIACLIYASLMISCFAAGPYPEPLSSSSEIRAAKPTLDSIDIWNLPLEDYPLLSKFGGLKRIRLFSREGTFTTDEKLIAISDINFTNLIYVNLNNCRLVTDMGVQALSKCRSLKQLQLEGTLITDSACFLMASNMTLTCVYLANCSGVTKAGLSALAQSKSLQEIGFSTVSLTPDEVLTLFDLFKNITWCEIVDLERKLDPIMLKKEGAKRKIHVTVRPTGALQDMQLRP